MVHAAALPRLRRSVSDAETGFVSVDFEVGVSLYRQDMQMFAGTRTSRAVLLG
ncbi:MAG: hypothetical protein KKD17_01765 [Nanoarchaeota archaeon]|nr:hypothetical protein [Nanoarchaeota archaeon]